MTPKTSIFVVGILLTSALLQPALAQTPILSPTPVRIQVVLSVQKPDGTTPGGIRTLSLTTSPTGTFSVSDLIPGSFAPQCAPPPGASWNQMGGKVEGTLSPAPDGRFQIHLNVSYKSESGCRQVGNTSSPVVYDEKITKDAVVSEGEVVHLSIKKSGGETLRVDVTLNAQK